MKHPEFCTVYREWHGIQGTQYTAELAISLIITEGYREYYLLGLPCKIVHTLPKNAERNKRCYIGYNNHYVPSIYLFL